ncbi:lipopolysaccharide biosynthesis protein [Shewanella algae]|uniref:lipopolysaccharide biosynthesis protein n=1 Tax=Shewanella algae TaxID=38313 RepID=UPI00313EF6CE
MQNSALSDFLKKLALLSSSAILSQLIILAFTPLVTRLYSPNDFNSLAIYAPIVLIISSISAGRYDICIAKIKYNKDALGVLFVCYFFILFSFLITFAFVIAFYFNPFFFGDFDRSLYLMPVGILFAGFYLANNSFLVRLGFFNVISKVRICQAVACVFIQVLLGFYSFGTTGLILGLIANSLCGSVLTLHAIFKCSKLRIISKVKLLALAKRNIIYPKASILESLSSSIGAQIPILIIAFHGDKRVGLLLFASRFMAAPVGFVANSISSIFISKANSLNKTQLSAYVKKIQFYLGLVLFPPFLLLIYFSPGNWELIFGDEWVGVGYIIAILAPMLYFQMISVPVSMISHFVNSQKQLMCFQIFGVILRVFPLIIAIHLNFQYVIELFAFLNVVFYLLFCFFNYWVSTKNEN